MAQNTTSAPTAKVPDVFVNIGLIESDISNNLYWLDNGLTLIAPAIRKYWGFEESGVNQADPKAIVSEAIERLDNMKSTLQCLLSSNMSCSRDHDSTERTLAAHVSCYREEDQRKVFATPRLSLSHKCNEPQFKANKKHILAAIKYLSDAGIDLDYAQARTGTIKTKTYATEMARLAMTSDIKTLTTAKKHEPDDYNKMLYFASAGRRAFRWAIITKVVNEEKKEK